MLASSAACWQAAARPAFPSGVAVARFQASRVASSATFTCSRASPVTFVARQVSHLFRYSSQAATPMTPPVAGGAVDSVGASSEAVADATLTLTVLFEDDALIAIDKPAGVPTQPIDPGETGTVANALLQLKANQFLANAANRLHAHRHW